MFTDSSGHPVQPLVKSEIISDDEFETKIKKSSNRSKFNSGAHKWNDKISQQMPHKLAVGVSKEKLKKYKRGHSIRNFADHIQTQNHQFRQHREQHNYIKASKNAAKAEFLLTEEPGYIEADEGETTASVTQTELVKNVDITSATKHFDLHLDKFGPYTVNYTRNGRHVLIAGKSGHCAAFDWQTKDLVCEFNVMETIQTAKWLHRESMFAVAQKKWVYIYDDSGIEIHCIKKLDSVLQIEFLPYHFIMATSNAKSYLAWLDISIGDKLCGHSTGMGRLDVMCQNPANGIVNLAHPNGRVTMWSPNNSEPLVTMLCHQTPIRSIAMEKTGTYMATSAVDRKLKIWDVRMLRELHCYRLKAGASTLNFSGRNMLAAGVGNVVEVYKDVIRQPTDSVYMLHRGKETIRRVEFCPYEDVLCSGHGHGITSLIIPGSGEPNFDAFEDNPFATNTHKNNAEIKALLEKIPSEMITMNSRELGEVVGHTMSAEDVLAAKINQGKFTPSDATVRMRKKANMKSSKVEHRKTMQKNIHTVTELRNHITKTKLKEMKERKMEKRKSEEEKSEEEGGEKSLSVLDRFKKKKKSKRDGVDV